MAASARLGELGAEGADRDPSPRTAPTGGRSGSRAPPARSPGSPRCAAGGWLGAALGRSRPRRAADDLPPGGRRLRGLLPQATDPQRRRRARARPTPSAPSSSSPTTTPRTRAGSSARRSPRRSSDRPGRRSSVPDTSPPLMWPVVAGAAARGRGRRSPAAAPLRRLGDRARRRLRGARWPTSARARWSPAPTTTATGVVGADRARRGRSPSRPPDEPARDPALDLRGGDLRGDRRPSASATSASCRARAPSSSASTRVGSPHLASCAARGCCGCASTRRRSLALLDGARRASSGSS